MSDRKKIVQETTNQLLTEKFATEIGQKARVERSAIESEHMDKLREVIAEVGQNLLEVGAVPKGMQYCGSLSVHVYKSEALKTAAFATVSKTEGLDLALADGALRELTGTTFEYYGKRRQKQRSGF